MNIFKCEDYDLAQEIQMISKKYQEAADAARKAYIEKLKKLHTPSNTRLTEPFVVVSNRGRLKGFINRPNETITTKKEYDYKKR